ncbi:MAG: hypothetical protein KBG20_01505 [Caldilineaceae bacterium]|nr:hypothetical protein [Caldilineaceae bacterium]MBP8107394.1 hypothetical protein [Caldilineaceae bacterium]MBP8124707.1 hypothetical protein [Caldilineaceae bacterium]MBP9070937.1 hypothetical protein [Caldilineaceae bacterium]
MQTIDTHQETIDAIVRRISDLNEQSLTQLSQYISYLKWQEELWHSLLDDDGSEDDDELSSLVWQYDFVENFAAARQAATRTPDLMEIKVGLATCGMVQQSALWQHPPVIGGSVCEYEVTVPAEVERLHLRLGVGIRDGALMEGDNLCAFRIIVNGTRVWSTTKQSNNWERFQIDLPTLAGQKVLIQFMTDGLGDARWNWAVWAEPQLLGYGG